MTVRAKDLDVLTIAQSYARCYVDADEVSLAAGRAWYRKARRDVTKVAKVHGVDRKRALAIVAALSPQRRWSQNLADAEHVLSGAETMPVGALGANVRKAWRILEGEDPSAVLGGRKVRAFYRALKGDESAAVIDTWMLTAVGFYIGSLTPAKYAILADALAIVAADAGETVAAVQAIIWCHVRGAAE